MSPSTPIGRPDVLIVEDDPELAGKLVTAFSIENLTTAHAQTGPQGIELAQALRPQLILLDILLPQFSGYDVLKALKENSDTKKIPVVVVSILSAGPEQKKAFSLGAEDYLPKDKYTPDEIIDRVKHFLHRPHRHKRHKHH